MKNDFWSYGLIILEYEDGKDLVLAYDQGKRNNYILNNEGKTIDRI